MANKMVSFLVIFMLVFSMLVVVSVLQGEDNALAGQAVYDCVGCKSKVPVGKEAESLNSDGVVFKAMR